jgi:hypothetical protein
MFEHACKLGCEGSVSERRGSIYSAAWSSNWLKVKNPAAPAVQRERAMGRVTLALRTTDRELWRWTIRLWAPPPGPSTARP